jgi:hypothetical protein
MQANKMALLTGDILGDQLNPTLEMRSKCTTGGVSQRSNLPAHKRVFPEVEETEALASIFLRIPGGPGVLRSKAFDRS